MAYKQISPQAVAEGGTGASTLTGVLTGNGTSAITANAITQYATLVGGASNAVSNVSIGTAGQVLTSAGAGSNPSYATPDCNLLDAQTVSNASDLSSTAISGNGVFHLVVHVNPNTSTDNIILELSTNSGSSWLSSGYTSSLIYNAYNSTTLSVSSSTSLATIGVSLSNTTRGFSGGFTMTKRGAGLTQIEGCVAWSSSGTNSVGRFGTIQTTTGVNAIRLRASTGNITGDLFIYQLATS